jgi:hypothetical protein
VSAFRFGVKWLALVALAGCVHLPPVPDMSQGLQSPALAGVQPTSVTLPFVLDDNRVFVEVRFIRPDGTERPALAYVNMGSGSFVLSNKLFAELATDRSEPLQVRIGAMQISVPAHDVLPEAFANSIFLTLWPSGRPPTAQELATHPGQMAPMAAPLPVEAVLPPGLLQHFVIVFDYGAKTLTLAAPNRGQYEGTAIPIRVNPHTGFAIVDLRLGSTTHPFVIDNGGSYSGIRSVRTRLSVHPDVLRSVGGIGEANYTMAPAAPEVTAPVVRIPEASVGALALGQMGFVQIGNDGVLGHLLGDMFWDRIYSDKAGERVEGWIGGNVLRNFRLTLDYPGRMSYWQQQSPLETHDLDQVGLILSHWGSVTTVAGIAFKNGSATVDGVRTGDKLLRIDGLDTAKATRGELLQALHGNPGENRRLVVDRDGRQHEFTVPVTRF